MAKFFVSNNKALYDKALEVIRQSEFKVGFSYKSSDVYALTVKKLFINNVNAWCINDKFVIATGTPIYNESMDLSSLVDDFHGDVNQIRKHFMGQYGVVHHKNSETIIFGDPVGAYNIYYYNYNNEWFVSNSLSDMASILRKKICVSESNYIEECCQNSILCGESLYDGIKRLHGFEAISINKQGSLSIVQMSPQYLSSEKTNYVEKVDKLVNTLKYKAGVIYKVLGNPDIFMTGGLDARISLATYLSVHAKPVLHYGVGNSFITNTKARDGEIAEMFSLKYDLNLVNEDWTTPKPLYKYWKKYIEKYGVLAKNYAASDRVIKSFENLSNNISTFGYGGELYRNLPWIENMNKDSFTVEEFVDEYYIGSTPAKYLAKNRDTYREGILKKVKSICATYNLDPNHIKKEDNIFFLIEYRKYADTYLMNMLNMMRYSNLLLMEYDCLSSASVSVEQMKSSKFMLDVIIKLDDTIMDIPVFSHCIDRKYNKIKGTLEPPPLTLRAKLSSYIPSIVKRHIKALRKEQAKQDIFDYKALLMNNAFRHKLSFDSAIDKRYIVHSALLFEALYKKSNDRFS